MKLLLSEVGKADTSGTTALIYAAENQRIECVKVLLEYPEELKGTTKLIVGATCGMLDVVRQNLSQIGSNVRSRARTHRMCQVAAFRGWKGKQQWMDSSDERCFQGSS